jgi:hypothetical protein
MFASPREHRNVPRGIRPYNFRRIVVAAIFVAVVTTASVFQGLAVSQERTSDRDTFFERLMGGGAEKATVYVELPLHKKFFVAAKTAKERGAVWETFFRRVLREEPHFDQPRPVPYWGDFSYQKVDWSSVAAAVNVRVGDVLRVRTPTSEGSVKVARYAIHYNGPGDGNLLLAVAQPIAGFQVPATDILFAASRIPSCNSRCSSQKVIPDARTLESIRQVVGHGAKIPNGQQIKRIIAFEGRFTRQDRQYVVYVDFGTNSDTNPIGYWRTLILNTDLSILGVVGENEYTHIEPRSVGDINGDGLDEVWVGLSGYEGRHAGLIYWRGGMGRDAFRVIANAYNGA